ncbi:unnamed protein product (macronuclear) [Paramecium tetraurelia]|uniref:DBF4-type domain-containing protein n=1 Tax=Paramecium tetraurelia TaxID=5888 RepID=A0CB77_PARTE|nr:uncharacterized protein GSPATT00036827001 [Paramecium tetraurelia]CAK68044.1 unnamed protein product [Paramecium tetraurelia]|eukprot:XP_001435441.1 hypothetical protein (macronuclear) [Paramecium tetraurelia strain d4-2]
MAGEKLQSSGKRKCQPKCPEHQFNLQPKSTKCWLKNVTNIDFCPLYNDALSCYENIVPVFNQDEQQCLPGFILEVDRNDYIKSMQKYKEDHQKKVQEYTTKKTKLQIPKPGRKHRYCGVCRKPYDDYLDHIKSADHINCFNRHEFVHVILKIVSEDYKSKDENKFQNDTCFDVVTSAIPKKRGPKPKNPGQQAEPKKRGRKPAEPSLTKRIKTQPVQEQQFNPYRPQPPPYFPQHIIFPYPPPLNQMIAQIPFQQLVNLPFQIQFGQDINIERKIEDMILDGQIEDGPRFD